MNNNTPQQYTDTPQYIDVPNTITDNPHTKGGRPPKYTPELARSILIDIATTAKPIKQIAQAHGVSEQVFFYWRSVSPQFLECCLRANAQRAVTYADKLESDVQKLEAEIEDTDADPRVLNVKSSHFDRKWRHREWLMAKWNRRIFGDKLDIDQTVTVNPSELREQAWRIARDAEITDYNPDSSD